MRSLTLAIVGFVLLLATPALAESGLGFCSLNGVTVSSDVDVGYDGVGSAPAADFATASDSRLVMPAAPSDVAIASATKPPGDNMGN